MNMLIFVMAAAFTGWIGYTLAGWGNNPYPTHPWGRIKWCILVVVGVLVGILFFTYIPFFDTPKYFSCAFGLFVFAGGAWIQWPLAAPWDMPLGTVNWEKKWL